MNRLILLRGVQGCGKTTLAQLLTASIAGAEMFAADDFFIQADGSYLYEAEKIGRAHERCIDNTSDAMQRNVPAIVVHNTLASERELKPYIELAANYGYTVTSLVVENRHGNKDVHNVPQDVREKVANRLKGSIKLI